MFHVVLSSDSLSLPRPWFQHRPSDEPDKYTRFTETYPYILEKILARRFSDREVRVTNFATRASSLGATYNARLDIFSWTEPSVCIIHKGVVDCWPREARGGLPNTSVEEFSEIYKKLIEARNALGAFVPLIVIGICPTNARMQKNFPEINNKIKDYNSVLSNVDAKNMFYLDMEDAVQREGDLLLHPDGHHLSKTGHKFLADRLNDLIVRIATTETRTA